MTRPMAIKPHDRGPMFYIVAFTLISIASLRCSSAADGLNCPHLLNHYHQKHHREPKPYTDDSQMVYFLHVPRTAGRTFHSCMLKLGTPPERRCPKAYDHLRLNMTVPQCNLLSSHDDFSVVSMLPDNVAVLSHLRDPVDRFLSAYEFAVEVGSRAVNRPATFRKRPDKIATEDVWPWSYLVPFFAKDVKERVAKARQVPQPDLGNWIFVKHPDGSEYYYNKVLGYSKWNLTDDEKTRILAPLNPYDNPLVLSLKEFVRHPIAHELLHNGQAFQVLGVTNYSHWGDAGHMRHCFWTDSKTQESLVTTAVNRVRRFIHVGVTDRLMDSVMAAAVAMKFSLDGPAYGGGDDDAVPQIGRRRGRRPLATDRQGDHAGDDKGEEGEETVELQASDMPELAEKVREARTKLQSAQRQLFQANQAGAADDKIMSLKSQVGNLRTDLRDLQEALVEARSKLHTSTEPETESKKQAAQQAASSTKKLGAPLGVEYQRCANRAQARNLQRRDNSLTSLAMPDARHVSFSKAARKLIPQELLDEIRHLNEADTTLHKLGQEILDQHRTDWKRQGLLQELPQMPPARPIATPPVKFPFPKPNDDDTLGTDEL